ncbi:MAG: isochorismatase family cysteine hydrolase [Bacilli bacterium]|nr:isochorismatase family cysteine hydrolase [Bacilli bacterium]
MKKLLVVVDMQNDFIDGVLGTKEAQNIVDDVANYIDNFDGDVVFTRDTHQKNYMQTQEGKNLPVPHCIEGTNGWQINPKLNTKNKLIFDKPTFGSVQLGIWTNCMKEPYDEIYFCGVCTGICVINNVAIVKAYNPETKIKVIENLCACVTPETHKTAIEAMKVFQIDIV